MYHFKLIGNAEGLEKLQSPWAELLEKIDSASPFLLWEWGAAWWQVFAQKDDKLAVVVAYKDCQIVAIAPFVIRKRSWYGLPRKQLIFLGEGNADRSDIIVHEPNAQLFEELFGFIKKNLKWDIMYLREVPQESHFLQWIQSNKIKAYFEQDSLCPYLSYPIGVTKESFEKSLSRNMRGELRNLRNRLMKMGGVKFSVSPITGPSDQEWVRVQEVENQSSKARRTIELVFCQAGSASFQKRFLSLSSGIVKPLLTKLEVDEALVAYLYGFFFKRRYYAYNMAFLPEYARVAPGKLAMHETILHGIEQGWKEFDFLRGASHLKSRWSESSRSQQHITLIKPSIVNELHALLVFRVRPAIKRIKERMKRNP